MIYTYYMCYPSFNTQVSNSRPLGQICPYLAFYHPKNQYFDCEIVLCFLFLSLDLVILLMAVPSNKLFPCFHLKSNNAWVEVTWPGWRAKFRWGQEVICSVSKHRKRDHSEYANAINGLVQMRLCEKICTHLGHDRYFLNKERLVI